MQLNFLSCLRWTENTSYPCKLSSICVYFSMLGHFLNKFSSSLFPSTVEALVCAQDWIKRYSKKVYYKEEVDVSLAN